MSIEEAEKRRSELIRELEADRSAYLSNARSNYFASLVLLWGAIITSGTATILGLLPDETIAKWVVGVVGGVPALLTLASKQLGFAGKANWHYRKVDALKSFLRRLMYEQPCPPTLDNIAAVSRDLSRLDKMMSLEWESIFASESTKSTDK